MFTAGGWRSLYTLFQMVADGVTDDMRNYAPGWIIGKSFYARPQGIVPQKWRTPVDTNFFFLFQARAGGGVMGGGCDGLGLWWAGWGDQARAGPQHAGAPLPNAARARRASGCGRLHQPAPRPLPPRAHPQSCTKDGKVPWRPEDRHVPLIGGA